jgi:hypothetical protein
MSAADELCQTPAERAALARLRALSGVHDGPMERHGVRSFLLGEEIARRCAALLDREVLLVAALLHDGGLYLDSADRGESYVIDGRRFAVEIGVPAGWDEARIARCADAIERHHELREQWGRGVEVEVLRRADLAELVPLLGPVVGLDRAFVAGVRRTVPTDGAYRHIGGLALAEVRHHGPGAILRIFRPG